MTAGQHVLIAVLFGANIVLHTLWSPLFFNLQRPDWTLMEVPFLWLSILALILVRAPIYAGRLADGARPALGWLCCLSQPDDRSVEQALRIAFAEGRSVTVLRMLVSGQAALGFHVAEHLPRVTARGKAVQKSPG